jgi:hypothetical protein
VLVGIAAVVLLAVVGVGALRAGGGPARARLAAGDAAPPFAAPLALSGLDNDANVATPATVGEEAGAIPACEVRRPDVLNACALWRAGPLAVAFFSERSDECVAEVDRLDAAAGRHPRSRSRRWPSAATPDGCGTSSPRGPGGCRSPSTATGSSPTSTACGVPPDRVRGPRRPGRGHVAGPSTAAALDRRLARPGA